MERLGSYDVAVIGAGVMGSSAAYFAAKLGAKVTLIEKGLPGQEASGRNAGGVRLQGRHPVEYELALHSIKLWEKFRDEMGGKFEYVQGGNMALAFNDDDIARLKAAAERQQQAGLPIRYISGDEAREMAPSLSNLVLGANYCPVSGHANPILATRFLAQQAARAGAAIHYRTQVTGIDIKGGRVHGVKTDRGLIECRAVIAASGAWTMGLFNQLGINVPMVARRTQICVTTPMAPILKQFVTGNTVYIVQTVAGNLVIGGSGPWEDLGFARGTTFTSLRRFAARAADIMPAVATTSILRMWAGSNDFSPDGIPLIGGIGGIEGLVISVGHGGHGFALGPGVGHITSRLALGMDPGMDISGYSPARFPPDLDYASQYKRTAEPAP